MYRYNPNTRFRPRRPVRSFRDLEVYQKALEAAVSVAKHVYPPLAELEEKEVYPLLEEMLKTSLDIPRMIAEAHSCRFGIRTPNKPGSLELLEEAMTASNKMVVYLEQVRDIYGDKVEKVLLEEMIRKYIYNRVKMFNLLKAWKRFQERDAPRP